MKTPVKYLLPISCAAGCKQHDMISIIWEPHGRISISTPEGWRYDMESGYALCPDHAKCEIKYYDNDSVFVEPATHHE